MEWNLTLDACHKAFQYSCTPDNVVLERAAIQAAKGVLSCGPAYLFMGPSNLGLDSGAVVEQLVQGEARMLLMGQESKQHTPKDCATVSCNYLIEQFHKDADVLYGSRDIEEGTVFEGKWSAPPLCAYLRFAERAVVYFAGETYPKV